MRVTNNMVTRNYMSNLQRNFGDLNKYSEQVVTGRKFNTMSEDTSSAVRAMQVRRKLAQIPGYVDNAKSTLSTFSSAEKSLMQVSDLNKSVSALFTEGISDTCGPDERKAISTQIGKLQEELLSLANGQFGSKYIFGGTNTVSQPFTVDNGVLYYNGQDVSALDSTSELFKDASFVDIGLGITKDADGKIKENSVFKNTLVGLDFMGTGSNNLYQLMGDMRAVLDAGVPDKNAAGAILDNFLSATSNANLMLTTIGADTQYLDFTIDRLETEELNLTERQQNLEFVSSEEAIINFKMQEYVYNAALQMGQRLLQPTLFSFIS